MISNTSHDLGSHVWRLTSGRSKQTVKTIYKYIYWGACERQSFYRVRRIVSSLPFPHACGVEIRHHWLVGGGGSGNTYGTATDFLSMIHSSSRIANHQRPRRNFTKIRNSKVPSHMDDHLSSLHHILIREIITATNTDKQRYLNHCSITLSQHGLDAKLFLESSRDITLFTDS